MKMSQDRVDTVFLPIGDPPTVDHWSDFTVIYGCVSVGNVPQLTIDLIISTLIELNDCRLIGYIYSPSLMPMAGPDPYRFGGKSLATSCQGMIPSMSSILNQLIVFIIE